MKRSNSGWELNSSQESLPNFLSPVTVEDSSLATSSRETVSHRRDGETSCPTCKRCSQCRITKEPVSDIDAITTTVVAGLFELKEIMTVLQNETLQTHKVIRQCVVNRNNTETDEIKSTSRTVQANMVGIGKTVNEQKQDNTKLRQIIEEFLESQRKLFDEMKDMNRQTQAQLAACQTDINDIQKNNMMIRDQVFGCIGEVHTHLQQIFKNLKDASSERN